MAAVGAGKNQSRLIPGHFISSSMKPDFHIVSQQFVVLADTEKVSENSKELKSCRSTNHSPHS